jgi:DNA helicase-2/ATP-dependent DNA helicase PcrA
MEFPPETSLFSSGPKRVFEKSSMFDDFEDRTRHYEKNYGGSNSRQYSEINNNVKRPSYITPSSRSAVPTSASSGKPLAKLNFTGTQITPGLQNGTTHNGMNLRTGQSIVHERFGKGRISEIEGTEGNCTITVDFDNSGSKRLLLKFARFNLLD